jgi:cell wall assembly regulator SMI1
VKFEEAIGVPLPADYKLSLAIHEGVKYWVWLWDAVSIPEITQVLDFWKSNIEASSHSNNQGVQLISQGAVRRSMFDKLWIPVANDNGIPICLDLNPLPGGIVGQVICVDWEDGVVRVIANGFIEFLEGGLEKMRKVP